MTYTYALLDVTQATYDEIAGRLRNVPGYSDAFIEQGDGRVAIDMHGLALVPPVDLPAAPLPPYIIGIDPAVEGSDRAAASVIRASDNKVLGSFDPTGMSHEQMEARALEIARGSE